MLAMEWCVWDGNRNDRVHISYYGGICPYAFGEHGHRGFVELTLVRKGVLEHQLAGIWRTQRKGALSLVRSGEAHALRGTAIEYINISFDQAYLDRLEPTVAAALARPAACVVALPPSRQTLVEADCDALDAAIAAGQPALRDALLLNLLSLVAVQLLRAAGKPALDGPTWLHRLRERIESDDAPTPSLERLRQLAGVAPEHLARTVRRCLGCTPTQWLRQRRLAKAARLLAATDLAVATIAGRCGYSSPELFHRHFSSVHSLGPRAYRQREQRFLR